MFGLFKKRAVNTKPPKTRRYPLPSQLEDSALVSFIKQVFQNENVIVASLFLIGLQNFGVYYSVFINSMKQSEEYPPTLEGMSAFILDSHAEHSSNSTHDEINTRRWFYLYVAALLTVAYSRAKQNPTLWDDIAEVWVSLMPGAQALRNTIDSTSLWKPSETDFFNEFSTEDDGEKYVESILIPNEVRFHSKLIEWQERDLPQEIRDELAQIDRLIRGKVD